MDDEIRIIVIATRFDDKPTSGAPAKKPAAGLFTTASEKKEAEETVQEQNVPVVEEVKPVEQPKEEENDPLDEIFKIFDSKYDKK